MNWTRLEFGPPITSNRWDRFSSQQILKTSDLFALTYSEHYVPCGSQKLNIAQNIMIVMGLKPTGWICRRGRRPGKQFSLSHLWQRPLPQEGSKNLGLPQSHKRTKYYWPQEWPQVLQLSSLLLATWCWFHDSSVGRALDVIWLSHPRPGGPGSTPEFIELLSFPSMSPSSEF